MCFYTPTLHWPGFQTEASLSLSHLLTINLFHLCHRVLPSVSPSCLFLSPFSFPGYGLSLHSGASCPQQKNNPSIGESPPHPQVWCRNPRPPQSSSWEMPISVAPNPVLLEIFPVSLKTSMWELEALISLFPRLLAPQRTQVSSFRHSPLWS